VHGDCFAECAPKLRPTAQRSHAAEGAATGPGQLASARMWALGLRIRDRHRTQPRARPSSGFQGSAGWRDGSVCARALPGQLRSAPAGDCHSITRSRFASERRHSLDRLGICTLAIHQCSSSQVRPYGSVTAPIASRRTRCPPAATPVVPCRTELFGMLWITESLPHNRRCLRLSPCSG
jgi:hypothetical protein